MTAELNAATESALVDVFGRAKDIGLLGPGPVEDHIEHARRYLRACSSFSVGRFVDLGSGAGVPGLVLALGWPDSTGVLLEASEKRAAFLYEATAELGLSARVSVVRDRSENYGRSPARGSFDLVSARSFGKPAITAEAAAPLLCVGGFLAVSEPPSGSAERWPPDALAALGLSPVEVRDGIALLQQVSESPERYPRRVGIPDKRPIF